MLEKLKILGVDVLSISIPIAVLFLVAVVVHKLFGKKKAIASNRFAPLLVSTQNDIFRIYGVAKPTDAQRVKAAVYICITGIAILNDLGGGRQRPLIDKLVDETGELTKSWERKKLLRMTVGELVNSKEEIEELSRYCEGGGLNESTVVNGLAALDCLYNAKVEKLINDILSHKDSEFGIPGYATIVVADGIFGRGESTKHFMEVSMRLKKFTGELVECVAADL